MTQQDIFSFLYDKFTIGNRPVYLIELFAGIGSQAKALERLGVNFKKHKVVEFDKYAIQSYNAIHNTNFTTLDIRDIHAKDLEIKKRDEIIYMMTYSFPCQDLSNAGKMRGMSKGSNTRSGLLWEVERLLNECAEELPQILIMENVPQVIGKRNIDDFKAWEYFLETKGYSNYCQLLNSKNYGIPQNRKRCFMVSILGDYSYIFPKKIPLKLKLKDMLEDNVDEKYYLSDKMLEYITSKDDKYKVNENKLIINRHIACSKTTREGNTRADTTDYICDELPENTNILKIKNATKQGYLKAQEGDGVDISKRMVTHRGTVQKGIIQTIKTQLDVGVVVKKKDLAIRKLTPKECWRLMGFDDEDYNKASKVVSETQLYKQAGNSIVVNVLEALIKEML